jgi:hypothetical protein
MHNWCGIGKDGNVKDIGTIAGEDGNQETFFGVWENLRMKTDREDK